MNTYLIVNYSGIPIESMDSLESADQRVKELNDALSPWEVSAGYFYHLRVMPIL